VDTVILEYRFKKNHPEKMDAFLSCWFNPSVQELLAEAAKKF